MSNKIPRWLPVPDGSAVLQSNTGLIHGRVNKSVSFAGMWVGVAATAVGVSHYAPTKEKAMEFVVEALQKAGRL